MTQIKTNKKIYLLGSDLGWGLVSKVHFAMKVYTFTKRAKISHFILKGSKLSN